MLSTPLLSDFARKPSRSWRGPVEPSRHESLNRSLLIRSRILGFQYAKSLWKSFESEFGEIEKELKRQNENVTEETRLASDQAASQARHLQTIDRQAASKYRKDGWLFRKRVDQSSKETQTWRLQVEQRESSELLLRACQMQ